MKFPQPKAIGPVSYTHLHPNITIEVLLDPDEQITSILQTKLAAGQPSDIVVYNKVSAENELDAVNNFVDLSDEPFVDNLIDCLLYTSSSRLSIRISAGLRCWAGFTMNSGAIIL